MRWKVDNILDLGSEIRFSDVYEIGGFKWKMGVYRDIDGLTINTYIVPENLNNGSWLCKLRGLRKMLKQDGSSDHYNRPILPKNCFCESILHCYCRPFNDWNTMIKDGFIKDGSIVIEVELDFVLYDFGSPIKGITNMITCINGTDFHCNREVLSTHSAYCLEHFQKLDKQKQKWVIPYIGVHQFLHFLATLSPIPLEILEENVVDLMDVAEKLRVPSLHYKCEHFLINSSKMPLLQKVEYAFKYKYETLMKKHMDQFKTAADVKKFTETEGFEGFNESLKLRVFQEYSKFV